VADATPTPRPGAPRTLTASLRSGRHGSRSVLHSPSIDPRGRGRPCSGRGVLRPAHPPTSAEDSEYRKTRRTQLLSAMHKAAVESGFDGPPSPGHGDQHGQRHRLWPVSAVRSDLFFSRMESPYESQGGSLRPLRAGTLTISGNTINVLAPNPLWEPANRRQPHPRWSLKRSNWSVSSSSVKRRGCRVLVWRGPGR
jgi:hypothetical protein